MLVEKTIEMVKKAELASEDRKKLLLENIDVQKKYIKMFELHKELVWELDTLIKRFEKATGIEPISAKSALRRAKSCAK